jgi:hypothetical protein
MNSRLVEENDNLFSNRVAQIGDIEVSGVRLSDTWLTIVRPAASNPLSMHLMWFHLGYRAFDAGFPSETSIATSLCCVSSWD